MWFPVCFASEEVPMVPTLAGAFLFIASNVIYWYLTIKTGYLSTVYSLQLALLGLSTASGIWLFLVLLDSPTSVLQVLLLAFVAFLTLVTLSLITIMLFIKPGDRMRSLYSYSRSFARFDLCWLLSSSVRV
jgi:hypothetical protein